MIIDKYDESMIETGYGMFIYVMRGSGFPRNYTKYLWDETPMIKDVHKKLRKAIGKETELLDMDDWHQPCGTAHCRAGWLIELGDAYELERELLPYMGDSKVTGQIGFAIYCKSDPDFNYLPNWFDSKNNAIHEIWNLADGIYPDEEYWDPRG